MQIVDTAVLIAFLDKNDARYEKANQYVLDIGLREDLFVPSATVLEFDLALKAHGVAIETRVGELSRLARLIPDRKVLPLTPAVLARTAELSKRARWRDSYFDTVIAATGLEYGADSVITTDRKFSRLGLKVIF